MRLMIWPDGERYLHPLQSLVVSLLLSLVSTLVYSRDWRRTVSSKFFDTQVPSISTEELVLPGYARCVFLGLRCNGHSLLLGCYLSRIGRIENPSCSAGGHSSQDTSHLILHCATTDSLATLCFSTTSGPDPGELSGFWGSMVFRHAPIHRKGSGNQQQQKLSDYDAILVTRRVKFLELGKWNTGFIFIPKANILYWEIRI